MPAIPKKLLNCVFYLFPSHEAAVAGTEFGGTGVLVAAPTEDRQGQHYAVSNHHVAVKGNPFIRLNTTQGIEVIETDPSDWSFTPGVDLAVLPINLRKPEYEVHFLSTEIFIEPKHFESGDLALGDDVFMAGRHLDVVDTGRNSPALRFGNLSTSQVEVRHQSYGKGTYYCVDMHSRSGFSGSPVFLYRTPGNDLRWLTGEGTLEVSSSKCAFLGIHCGQFPERMEVRRIKPTAVTKDGGTPPDAKEYVEGYSGMNLVVPANQLLVLIKYRRSK